MTNVLYLEVDEDITSAIEKLVKSKAGQVQLVAPKRSTMLQSVINLKLLKKAADEHHKELVLVTGDKTTINLAGRVGLAVASSLKSAPKMPKAVEPEPDQPADVIEGEAADLVSEDKAGGEPSSLAPAAPLPTSPDDKKPVLTRRPVDDEPETKKPKAARVPDFNALQKRLLWVGGAVAIVIALIVGNYLLKSATVTLYAKGSRVPASFNLTVDPATKQSDQSKAILAGQQLQLPKELSGSTAATGKQDVGTKAKGTISVNNEYDSSPHTLVAGTRFQTGDKVFRSTGDVTVPGSTVKGGKIVAGSATVEVEADGAGDQYNLGPARYSIPALPADQQAGIYGLGNQMSGGTSKQITVVAAADVEKAKTEALAKAKDSARKELEDKADSGSQLIGESYSESAADVSPQPAVGSEASQVTVSFKANYSELAVSKHDYSELLKAQELKQVGAQNQIYDDGSAAAKVSAAGKDAAGRPIFHIAAEAYAGAKIDTAQVATKLAGQRYGDAADTAAKLPGVDKADVSIHPGWSSKMPRRSGRIKIEIKVAAPGA